MTGAGSLEDYGDVSVIFTLEDKADFNITWETELPTSPIDTTTEATTEATTAAVLDGAAVATPVA